MSQVRVGVGVFVFKNGQFIMGRRKGSHGEASWSVPGGHLEFGETLEAAAAREVEEETNVTIKNLRIGAVTNDIFEYDDKHYITVWMLSEWESGEVNITEPDTFLEVGWYDFNSLPSPLFQPWQQLMKSRFFREIKKTASKN